MIKLVMLGTGHAMVTKCYNTCFVLDTENGSVLVDAGGGNGILTQMEKAGLDWVKIKALFITHAHTDHIVGCIWVLRKINSLIKNGRYAGNFQVYGQEDDLNYLKYSCDLLLNDALNAAIRFIPVCDGEQFCTCGMDFTAIDIHSTKKSQMGFKAVLKNRDKERTLVCLGDEPCHVSCESYVRSADWLLCEAFCLKSEEKMFRAYEKHHSTAYDAGKTAERLDVKNLVLYHTEDTDLPNRARKYTEEARQSFSGNVFVPDDLEVISVG